LKIALREFFVCCFIFLVLQSHLKAQTSDIQEVAINNRSDSLESSKSYLLLAIELQQTDLVQSVNYSRKGLQVIDNMNASPENDSVKIELLLVVGNSYISMGFYSLASDRFLEAREVARNAKNPILEAKSLNYIGNLYWYLNEFQKALPYYRSYAELGFRENNQKMIEIGTMNIGVAFLQLNQLDSANLYLKKALDMGMQGEPDDFAGLANMNYGWYLQRKGLSAESLEYYTIVEEKYLEFLPAHYVVFLYTALAELNIILNNKANAEHYATKSKKAAEQSQSKFLLMHYYELRYKIDSAQNNQMAALKSKVNYLEYARSVEQEKSKNTQNSMELLYQLDLKESELSTLRLENERNELEIQRNRIRLVVGAILLILLVIIVFIVLYAYRLKRKTEQILIRKNQTLKQKTEELEALNEEFLTQRENLYEKNQELEKVLLELKTTQNQLLQAEKITSIGTLAAGVAHEINNPLNFIIGGITSIEGIVEEIIVLSAIAEKDKNQTIIRLKESIKMVQEGVRRTSDIVEALAAFVHRDKSDLAPTDLNQIINNTIQFIQVELDDNIYLESFLSPLPSVMCYPGKMYQALLNILNNAIVVVKQNPPGNRQISVDSEYLERSSTIEIRIINNGPKIDEAILPRIFDPFFTTKDPDKGKGLGLSTSYTIIDEINGSIIARNRQDGVEFLIEVPVVNKHKT
jgi:two-component system NtrC family sensor kinase